MKSKWGVLRRFVTGALKPAVQMPNSDKLARFNLWNWGGLCVMVSLIIVMVTLMQAWGWAFWLGFNLALLAGYATMFIWSVEGYFYRRDVKREEATRKAFDDIVRNS